mgnify:CR=1 FL=1
MVAMAVVRAPSVAPVSGVQSDPRRVARSTHADRSAMQVTLLEAIGVLLLVLAGVWTSCPTEMVGMAGRQSHAEMMMSSQSLANHASDGIPEDIG